MGKDPNIVTMRERVRVVKVDKDNPEKEPEVIEQETVTPISLDDAALLGFVPGQGFSQSQEDKNIMNRILEFDAGARAAGLANRSEPEDVKIIKEAWGIDGDGPPPPVEGARVGDE